MSDNQPTDRTSRSRWKWVSVVVILAILGLVLLLNLTGWQLKPFGSTFKSQPSNSPTSAPTK
jgi:hypothetical protein